jgi:hypothetical protein
MVMDDHYEKCGCEESKRLREALTYITENFEEVIAESARPKGGMSVPFRNDFMVALQHPSTMSKLRWWATQMRAVLSGREWNG